jgi:hypothetical protein
VLLINKAQIAAMEKRRGEIFRARLAAIFAHRLTEPWAQVDDREKFLDRVIARARSHGLTTERAMAKYAILSLALGEDFAERKELEWATRRLRRAPVPADARMDLVAADLATHRSAGDGR